MRPSGRFKPGGWCGPSTLFEFVGTDKAYSSKLNKIARKAIRGLNRASACTAESLGAYLKSPVFGEAPRLVRISRAKGSNQGMRLICTKIILLSRAHLNKFELSKPGKALPSFLLSWFFHFTLCTILPPIVDILSGTILKRKRGEEPCASAGALDLTGPTSASKKGGELPAAQYVIANEAPAGHERAHGALLLLGLRQS